MAPYSIGTGGTVMPTRSKGNKSNKGSTSTNNDAELRAKALAEYERLLKLHGEHPLVPRREPMHELISTILSHRTTQKNEAEAYDNMWKHFGSWEAIRDAPLEELIESLSPATFPEVKAPYIQGSLKKIFEVRGEASIEFL